MTRYVKCYSMQWDEMFQVEVDDDTVIPQAIGIEVSDKPFPDLKIRPRSIEAADRQRQEEYDAIGQPESIG